MTAIFAVVPANGATYYASPSGSSTAAGTSADPFDLATAVEKFTGHVDVEVVLKDGTYKITETINVMMEGSDDGSFRWTFRSESDDPSKCIIDAQENCRCLRMVKKAPQYHPDTWAHIRGITFRNGRTTAILTDQNSSKHCAAGMSFQGVLENCIVEDCSAVAASGQTDMVGAGIHAFRASVITNCIIRNCSITSLSSYVARGAGLVTERNTAGDPVKVFNTQFINCSVANAEGGDKARGGAVYAEMPVIVENSLFENCSAAKGGVVYQEDKRSDLFTDCTFRGNSATIEGGVSYSEKNEGGLDFDHCVFENNSAQKTAVFATNYGRLSLSNSVVRANRCATGAIFNTGAQSWRFGNVLIENNLANTNTADNGGIFRIGYRSSPIADPHSYENLMVRDNTTSPSDVEVDGIFVFAGSDGGFTNIVVRNGYFTGNTATTFARCQATDYRGVTEDCGYGWYFQNCTVKDNTFSTSYAMFQAKESNAAGMLFVRNCDLRGNTGTNGKILSDEFIAKSASKAHHCAVDAGATGISSDAAYANQFGGETAGKGSYEEWMDGAQDGGDGTIVESVLGDYGVDLTFNGQHARVLGARPDIGAMETDEGGTFTPSAFKEAILPYTGFDNALVMSVGDTFTLPDTDGGGIYVNYSGHRFLSIEDNTLTALSAGIGMFDVYNTDYIYVGRVYVFIKPTDRPVGNAYVLKSCNTTTSFNWSDPANWRLLGSDVNESYPDGETDIAFVPYFTANTTVYVDGSYDLTGLYISWLTENSNCSGYLKGAVSDGSAALSFYGTTGKNAAPAEFMAASQAGSNVFGFYPRGDAAASKITFKIAKGDLNIDCGGPTDKTLSGNSSAYLIRWWNDKVHCGFDIPEGSTMRLVNGIRKQSFGDDQEWSVQHVSWSSVDIFTGAGTLELNSRSAVNLGDNSLRSFKGTVRSQSLNYLLNFGVGNRRSGIVWSKNVNATNVIAEINGYVTRDFSPQYGVGAWTSGIYHGTYSSKNESMNGNGLPERGLFMNGGALLLYGLDRAGNDDVAWKRSDGGYEAHCQTAEFHIGKGLSYFSNYQNNDPRNDPNIISHFIADKMVHSDSCGTLRVSDVNYRNKKTEVGSYRAETQFHGFADYYVGNTTVEDESKNIFPIVPWIIGDSDGNASYFWWAGVDDDDYVVMRGRRTGMAPDDVTDENVNVYYVGNVSIKTDKTFNSLIIRDNAKTQTLGEGRTLTLKSGGLGLEDVNSGIGTQTGGEANGNLVFPEKAFVYATSGNETQPDQLWAKISAPMGFVAGYAGHLLLGGDQSGIKGEFTVNNGTVQFGSMDGTVACTNGAETVRAIGGNTVLRLNAPGGLTDKLVYLEGPGGFLPKINLQNAEMETVTKLYLDGTTMRAGVWGATGSGAANIDDDRFSGPGQLRIRHDDLTVGFSMVFRP